MIKSTHIIYAILNTIQFQINYKLRNVFRSLSEKHVLRMFLQNLTRILA